MKAMTTLILLTAFLVALCGAAAGRQYRGRVNMRGPIRGRRVRMRAPVHAGRRNPHYAYDSRERFNEYKRTWGTFSDRYDWNYQFKDVDSTDRYRMKGYPSQTTDYDVD